MFAEPQVLAQELLVPWTATGFADPPIGQMVTYYPALPNAQQYQPFNPTHHIDVSRFAALRIYLKFSRAPWGGTTAIPRDLALYFDGQLYPYRWGVWQGDMLVITTPIYGRMFSLQITHECMYGFEGDQIVGINDYKIEGLFQQLPAKTNYKTFNNTSGWRNSYLWGKADATTGITMGGGTVSTVTEMLMPSPSAGRAYLELSAMVSSVASSTVRAYLKNSSGQAVDTITLGVNNIGPTSKISSIFNTNGLVEVQVEPTGGHITVFQLFLRSAD